MNKVIALIFNLALAVGLTTLFCHAMDLEEALPREVFISHIMPLCGGSLNNLALVCKGFTAATDDCTYELPERAIPFFTDARIARFKNLKVLHLYNCMTIASTTVDSLTNLTALNLGRNMNIANATLAKMTQLRILNLEVNHLIIDDTLTHLTNLEILSLAYNHNITDAALVCLPNLTRLDLSSNSIITDNALTCLTNLTELVLENNTQITDEAVVKLTKLTNVPTRSNTIIAGAVQLPVISQEQLDDPLTLFLGR